MYLELTDLFGLALLSCALLYWWHAYQIKERTLNQVKKHLKELDLQLLDQSIALKKTRIQRSAQGHLNLSRLYQFSFSSNGDDRYLGEVQLSGPTIISFHLPPYRV